MSDIQHRLRASVRIGAVHGDMHERSVCARQMVEAADEIDRLRAAVQHEADCVEAAKAEIDRLTRELAEAREESEAVRFANVEGKMWVDNVVHDIRRLSSAIRWALGYDEGDPQFGEQPEQKGAFAWRTELRRRAGAAIAQIEQERSND